jgi:signal transduction histidine kinase/CheY-like chemotaxis protein
VVGNYAFYAIGKALHQVTEESVPPAIATLELAQSSVRIVAAGPALLAVTSDEEFKTESAALDRQLKAAGAFLDKLPGQGLTADKLIQFRIIFRVVTANLESLKSAVQSRISAADRKAALVGQTFDAYNNFRTIWAPKFNELKAQIASLQRVLDAAGSSPEARMAAVGRLNAVIRDLGPLEQMQQEAANVFEALVRAASATTPAVLETIRKDADLSVRHIDDLVSGLDPDLSFELIVPISRMRANAVGPASVIAVREVELQAIQEGRRLTVENSELSAQLSSAAAALVAASQQGIAGATARTESVQSFGRLGLAAAVALSLISSVLIGWLYVGRNVVARLTTLSDGMRALVGGRRDIAIPTSGSDEIAEMARAVEVFRDNAIALDQLLAEREQAAAQLEKVVDQRTAELQQRGAVLRVTFDNMAHGVLTFDREQKVAAWNRQVTKLLELPEAFLAGKPHFADFIRFLAERGEYGAVDVEAEVQRFTAEAGQHRTFERSRPDGTVLEIRHNPLPDGEMVIIYTDVTERKRYEETLTAARDAADEANRTKSGFLANMSHELRTPLNAIIGVTEMLQEDARDLKRDDEIEPLERVLGAGRHLLTLINDILDLSKIEAGRMELHVESFSVTQLIGDAVKTVETLAAKNANRVVTDCSPALEPMQADQMRVRQALLNLLSNANKFTERGTITINARQQIENGQSWITIAVTDSGIGMTAEQMGKLFQEFSQADSSMTRKYGGTGLGLAISRRFCQMMGGDILVESELGRGSTFTMRLPRIMGRVQDVAAAQDGSARSPSAASLDAPLILVVDDDQTVREVIKRFLERVGYAVVTASGGQEGLRLARNLRPAAITLDVMMPDLDGWTVLTAIKGDPELASIPVILMTIVDEKNRGYSLGAYEYLVKPINRDKLAEVLRNVCGSVGGHVLVIDDDDTVRRGMRLALEPAGWKVTDAENGQIALDRLAATRPDAIILDLMMPEMDGFEFLEELRRRAEWRDIPVVVVTGRDLTEEDRSRLNGAVERIIQKIDRDTMLQELHGELSKCIARRRVETMAEA